MGKLIDTDALKAVLMETKAESGNIGEVIAMIFCGVIDEQPEAVVRCKDCKYQNKGSNEVEAWNLCNFRSWLYIPISDYCFCSFGERRTDERSKTNM